MYVMQLKINVGSTGIGELGTKAARWQGIDVTAKRRCQRVFFTYIYFKYSLYPTARDKHTLFYFFRTNQLAVESF